MESQSSQDQLDDNNVKFQQIYQRQLKKKQALEEKKKRKELEKRKDISIKEENFSIDNQRGTNTIAVEIKKGQEKVEDFTQPKEIGWYIYPRCPPIDVMNRVPHPMNNLPIFKKKDQIIDSIMKNQVVLVTGQTGCGKSTQVPRLIYEYLRNIGDNKSKIMCVQPRRLAVMNLQSMLDKQMEEKGLIGYQIGMKSKIKPSDRIVFVTNGIFLQRMVHGCEFFDDYPFILLDEVHERDIDTDFILLTIKRVLRLYPKLRVVLMSATIDNQLFRYYFASDHIDNILTEQNFYKKVILAKQKVEKEREKRRAIGIKQRGSYMIDEYGQNIQPDSDSSQDQKIFKEHSMGYMKSRYPCPTINVTEPGKYTRKYYYLDTLKDFLSNNTPNNQWGSASFSQKYPSTNKQLYQSVNLIIQQICRTHKRNLQKASVLIFMPGLAQIQQLSESIRLFFKNDHHLQILNVHSSILTEDITRKLLEKQGNRHKIIIATNIAESSITVLGVQYVIDFCLSKEVKFDLRSRMENLELVWASKASCDQRAGRTGRVCNGTIIRLLEKNFHSKLSDYSTPQIQRASLDKLVLRIKMLHQDEKNHTKIFAEPGEVLGSAIQPPQLKNIDTAINSLKFSGALEWKDGDIDITSLGRLYVDIPIDITYCKLLLISQLFGTFEDMLILVSILSQSKSAIRRGVIENNYAKYYQMVKTDYNCDFIGLLALFEETQSYSNSRYRDRPQLKLQNYYEVKDMKNDIWRRIDKKRVHFPALNKNQKRQWKIKEMANLDAKKQDYLMRFKFTLICGFIENILKVKPSALDDKQEKRLKLMKKCGIPHRSTLCLINSQYLRRPNNQIDLSTLTQSMHAKLWAHFKVKPVQFTFTNGLNYLHFCHQDDLHRILFYKYMEDGGNRRGERTKRSLYSPRTINQCNSPADCFSFFGDSDHMHVGRPATFSKDQGVFIDNYSLNRVVNMNDGDAFKYLITNNIAKQSSRMVARYTSLLPLKIKYIQTISHLLFFPFVSLQQTKQNSRYQFLTLNKRKHKVPIRYHLTNEEIQNANTIRKILREYLSMVQMPPDYYDGFSDMVQEFIFKERQQVVEEERWQEIFMKDLFQNRPDFLEAYKQFLASREKKPMIEEENYFIVEDRNFLNEIRTTELKMHFFSNLEIMGKSLEERTHQYNLWKQKKLKEVRMIERKALDRDTYLACGQDSCGLKLCLMKKVGTIEDSIFRVLYSHEQENVKQLKFDEYSSHFCTLLFSNYMEKQFLTFGCSNDHHFAVKVMGEQRLKILPFSQVMMIYPDGSAQKAHFKRMNVADWKKKHDQKLASRTNMNLSTYCFVCDEILTTFKNLESHIMQGKHQSNVKDFIRALPQSMRQKSYIEDKLQEDNSTY